MNYRKAGLLLSTILLVGAAGASISDIFTKDVVTTAIVEKVTPIEATNKVSKTLAKVSRITVTSDDAVLLDADVDYRSVQSTIAALDSLSKKKKEVFLLIDSPGGSVVDGAKLIAFIESSPVKINTVCVGLCASMAAHIHQSGAKRLMQDKSILMFHPASGGARGTMNEMLAMLTMLDTYTNRMDAAAANRSGIPYDEFKLRVLKNFWVEAQDAVQQRLADGLVYIVVKDSDVPSMSVTEKLGGKNVKKVLDPRRGNIYDIK